jgi:replicative DNA helicase
MVLSDSLTDCVPPHDRDAERAVLGGILRDPDVLPDVCEVLRADAMYFDAHQKMFAALVAIAGRGDPVDLVTARSELARRGHLDDVGGVSYLVEIWETVPTGANATYHTKLVRDAALRRAVIHTANETLRDSFSPTGSAEELLAAAERKLFAISSECHGGADPHRAGDLVSAAFERLGRLSRGEESVGLPTGYADLDYMLVGLRPGELTVIAARPSIGKTSLALGIATNATRAGVPVLFASLEMGRQEITERILAMRSGVPLRAIQKAQFTSVQRERVFAAGQAFAAENFHFDATTPMSAARLAAVVRRQVRRHRVGLVVVDYLGLMEPEDPRASRVHQVGSLSRRLKQLAQGCALPVVVLCQLNRGPEARADGKPKLSDLRDSGEVEQDADAVLLLSRQRRASEADEIDKIDVDVAKVRNGMTGEVTLAYRRVITRFENAGPDRDPGEGSL